MHLLDFRWFFEQYSERERNYKNLKEISAIFHLVGTLKTSFLNIWKTSKETPMVVFVLV